MADHLTKAQRSALMSRVRRKNTSLEQVIFLGLKSAGVAFRRNVKSLPGSPDVVFDFEKIAVFVDGDFWHGFKYSLWKSKLPPYWQGKIERNIKRDRKNFAKLRRKGWVVKRVWGHEIKKHPDRAIEKILVLKITMQMFLAE